MNITRITLFIFFLGASTISISAASSVDAPTEVISNMWRGEVADYTSFFRLIERKEVRHLLSDEIKTTLQNHHSEAGSYIGKEKIKEIISTLLNTGHTSSNAQIKYLAIVLIDSAIPNNTEVLKALITRRIISQRDVSIARRTNRADRAQAHNIDNASDSGGSDGTPASTAAAASAVVAPPASTGTTRQKECCKRCCRSSCCNLFNRRRSRIAHYQAQTQVSVGTAGARGGARTSGGGGTFGGGAATAGTAAHYVQPRSTRVAPARTEGCVLCLEAHSKYHTGPCGHSICLKCAKSWKEKEMKKAGDIQCPKCRQTPFIDKIKSGMSRSDLRKKYL